MRSLPLSPLVAALVAVPWLAAADSVGVPKADVSITLRVDDHPHADDAALLNVARDQALDQVLRGRLGDALVNENHDRILAEMAPDPFRFLRPVAAHHASQVNSLGFSDDLFIAGFAVDASIGELMQRIETELRSLPRPRLLVVRGDLVAVPAAPKAPATKGKASGNTKASPTPPPAPPTSSAKGRPGDSFDEVTTRLEGKLSGAGWRCLSTDDAQARLKGRPINDLEALRGAGLVGEGDVVVFLNASTSAEQGAVPGLTNIHTEVSWRAVEAASGDLLSAGSRVFSTPTVTESFERGYEAAALGVEEQIQGPVLDAWRKHSQSTGGVVVIVNGVEFEALAQLREALAKVDGAQVLDATLNEGSAQVRLSTQLAADQVAAKVAGTKLGKGVAKVIRVAPGRIELAVK